MMHFTPGSPVYVQVQLWCISKTSSAQQMLWGCKTLVAQCHRGKRWHRAVLEGREAHLDAASPGSAAAKARGLPLLQRSLCPPASASPLASGQEISFLPVVQKSLELSQCGSECRWSWSCSCAPETSSGSVLLGKVGAASPMQEGLGEKEELLGLQPELGVWGGEKLNRQSSIPAHNFPCVEEWPVCSLCSSSSF